MSTTYDRLQFKASHNSYNRDETLAEQLTFDPTDTSNAGCLAVELDIWRHTSDYVPYVEIPQGYFTVDHLTGLGGKDLSVYLDELKTWHNDNADHLPILVTLDIKSSHEGYDNFQDAIDTYLKCHFGEALIFKPGQLLHNTNKSLAENVVEHGWPSVTSSSLKGKFIFCLSGNSDWKAQYAFTNLPVRYCFSDVDKSDSDPEVKPPTSGDIVFFNFHVYEADRGVWSNTIPPFAESKFITRAYVVDGEDLWRNCMNANFSAIATNRITGHSWCKVSDTAEYKVKTEFYDKRYLKNKSNQEYRTNEATKMQDTYENPQCTFIFESYGTNVYALRNAYNDEYLDCSIRSMSGTVNGDCQKWRLIVKDASRSEYYVQNVENNEYLTRKASELSDKAGEDEVYIINAV